MKLRLAIFGLSALLAVLPAAHAGVHLEESNKPQVQWDARIYPGQFQSGIAGNLLKSLGIDVGPGKTFEVIDPAGIESLEFTGYQGDGKPNEPMAVADVRLKADGKSADAVLEALQQKFGSAPETVADHQTMRFAVPFAKDGQAPKVWCVKIDDRRILVCTNRSTLETALKSDLSAPSPLGPKRENELLSALVEVDSFPAEAVVHNSQVLTKMKHLEFHIQVAADTLRVGVSAAMQDGKEAKRVARMIEGLITMMSFNTPSGIGPALDDRLQVTSNGDALGVDVSLNANESKILLDALTDALKDQQKKSHGRSAP